MSFELNYPFLNPANYIFNGSEIDISSGGRLALQQDDIDFTEDFTSGAGLVYDNTKAEYLGDPDYLIRQKDQRPVNSIFGATYSVNMDASFGADGFGTLSPVLNGSPVVSGGKLSCIGNGLYYSSSLIGALSGNWVLKFKYTPKYTGAPSSNYNMIAIYPVIGPANRVVLFDNPTGLRFTANGLSAVNLGTWSPVAETEYVFEIVCIGNNVSIFIDDSQQGATQIINPGQGTDAVRLWIGACTEIYNTANGDFDDIILYSSASQNPVYIVPDYAYFGSVVYLSEMEHVGDGTIRIFNSFSTVESGALRYVLQIGRSGNYLYWNGSAWAVSDMSYAQANDQATFNANCGSLPVDGEEYGQFAVIFQDSNTISQVNEVTANMNVDTGYLATNPSLLINGTFRHENIDSFLATINKAGNDEITFNLSKDGVFYYWDGAAWSVADGTYAQSNTAADVQANKDSFTDRAVVTQIKVFFHSDTGATTPEITNLQVLYDYSGESKDTIRKCIVWAYSEKPAGGDVRPIKIRLNKPVTRYKNNVTYRSEEITVTPDADDDYYWEVSLPETVNMDEDAAWIFDFGNQGIYEVQIPDQDQARFWDIV